LNLSTSTAPPLAVRSDAPQAIRNGLRGYAELSRDGGLARILDQISPLRARCPQLGFEPRHAALERVQVPLLGRRQVPSRSRHALSVSPRPSIKEYPYETSTKTVEVDPGRAVGGGRNRMRIRGSRGAGYRTDVRPTSRADSRRMTRRGTAHEGGAAPSCHGDLANTTTAPITRAPRAAPPLPPAVARARVVPPAPSVLARAGGHHVGGRPRLAQQP
jgi:hypothetical protein